MRLRATIFMEPVGKARARTVRKGESVVTYTPDKTAHAENIIRAQIMQMGVKFEKGMPLRLAAIFYRSRPKSAPKRIKLPVTKPDWDNYAKCLCDALEKFVYENDSQITRAYIKKRYGSPPRIELLITEDEP